MVAGRRGRCGSGTLLRVSFFGVWRLAPREGPAQNDFRALGIPWGVARRTIASVYVCVVVVLWSFLLLSYTAQE